MPRQPPELTEVAWLLIEEAITTGTMTLENRKAYTLTPGDIVDLAKWLSISKAKKPHPVNIPEDFQLQRTGGTLEKEAK